MNEKVPSGFDRISFDTRIESPASEEQFLLLIGTVENHCLVPDTLNRPQSVTGAAYINGKPVKS